MIQMCDSNANNNKHVDYSICFVELDPNYTTGCDSKQTSLKLVSNEDTN